MDRKTKIKPDVDDTYLPPNRFLWIAFRVLILSMVHLYSNKRKQNYIDYVESDGCNSLCQRIQYFV